MSFRNRLLAAYSAVVVLPLLLLLAGVRVQVGKRLESQFQDRVNALSALIQATFTEQSNAIGEQLKLLAADLASDNRVRLALHGSDRKYLLDYAGDAMRRGRLSLLQIQDTTGRILSSGQYRNLYDRIEAPLGRLLAAQPNRAAAVRVRTPEGELTALARADSVTISGERLFVVGGIPLDALLRSFSREPGVGATARLPGDTTSTALAGAGLVRSFDFPYIDGTVDPASVTTIGIVAEQSREPLASVIGTVDRWFLAAGAATLALALVLAAWTASRVSSPLLELAEKTARLDLDRLDVEFEMEAEGEIGALSRLLNEMTGRLRTGMTKLREAERRATVGDLARQLNHDVKNGLIPVRNAFRHLAQVARDQPDRLPALLLERQGNIEAGISYLENLAKNYARLSPALDRQPGDLNATVRDVVQGMSGAEEFRMDLAPALPTVAADPLVIRRILENLVSNAVDSLDSGKGAVTVTTSSTANGVGQTIRLVVADQGKGMTERELERAFEDFYTTKPGGTGLGLSIVRRLVLDLHGSLRVETAPGSGTRFIIDLPAAT